MGNLTYREAMLKNDILFLLRNHMKWSRTLCGTPRYKSLFEFLFPLHRKKASASYTFPDFQRADSNSCYASTFGKLSNGHRIGKRSVFIPIPKNGNVKECSNCHTIVLISHASSVMLKILQARVQQYVNWEPPDV